MKQWNKRFFSVLLAAALLLSWLPPVQVLAEEAETEASALTEETVTQQAAPEVELPDNEELFAAFVERELYGYDFSTFGTAARAGLNAVEQQIYDALKAKIETVALNGGSTEFVISGISGLKTSWNLEEMGVLNPIEAVKVAFQEQFSLDAIFNALLNDCPFDLYWFDKTSENAMSLSYKISSFGYTAQIINVTFRFVVANAYSAGTYQVTSNVAKINTVKYNAAQVVAVNEGKSDAEKLKAYKEYICGEVTYNHTAADTPGYPYGDPWQMIYVFDDDISTNVVCEGYSKAFQYLCDLSGLDCISISGDTNGGGHMWNVVTLDGENYLVDVTNCDEGTAGAPDLLFMVGAPYKNGGYSFKCGGQTIFYQCEDLDLSETNYTGAVMPDPAIGGQCGDNATWTLVDGVLTISGTGTTWDYDSSLMNCAPWNEYWTEITAAVVEEGITGLGSFTLYGLSYMESVDLPEGLVTVGTYGISNNKSMKELVFPSTVKSLGQNVASTSPSMTKLVLPEGLETLSPYAFASCTKLLEVVVPESVTTFGEGVFMNNYKLESVNIPSSVKVIGPHTFASTAIKTIELPAALERIEDTAFNNCSALESITLPETVTYIGKGAFMSCSSLKELNIPRGVTIIEESTFALCAGLTELVIPATVEEIASNAFRLCTSLEKIRFRGAAPKIASDAFNSVTATVYYSPASGTWNAGNMLNYKGTLTWEAVEETHVHTEVVDAAKVPTCTETGLTEGRHCSDCGEILVKQETVQALGHTEETVSAKAPTCTETGLTQGKKCSVCQEVLEAQTTVPAMGHTEVADAAVEATCTETGLTAGKHCSVCGEVLVKQEKIPAAGHSYKDNVDGTCNVCSVNRETVELRKVHHMLRMYNPNTGEHFYTGSEEEKDNLVVAGWHYEGVAFTFPKNTGAPVHRLFQPSTGEHLYTMDEEEKATLMADGWNYEGIAFNSAYDTEAVQHRLHNPNATVGAYHFTFSEEEVNNLIAAGWEYQGIGWYSCWK